MGLSSALGARHLAAIILHRIFAIEHGYARSLKLEIVLFKVCDLLLLLLLLCDTLTGARYAQPGH